MKTQNFALTIGVDIAKKKFDSAALLDNRYKHKTFSNVKPLICMESTGIYSLPLADFLVSKGHAVSMVNPAKIHAFAKSELSRAKTDKADAKLIARYAASIELPLWIPPPAHIRQLQALVRRVEHLQEMIQMETNRLESANDSVETSINTVLTTLEAELKSTRAASKITLTAILT